MRWYLNDASLQGQFVDPSQFENSLRGLLSARSRVPAIKQSLRTTRSLQDAMAAPHLTVRQFLLQCRDKDLRSATFVWLDRTGPFVDDDRIEEQDDYFEFAEVDVTDTGLGEAARRIKAGEDCASYSFEGGAVDYVVNPIEVDHGLPEDRLGSYPVCNHWQPEELVAAALAKGPAITSWPALVGCARAQFPNLEIANLHDNTMLSREPFEASVRDRALALMGILDAYMAGRGENGDEGQSSKSIIDNYFKGERALFSGESPTHQAKFKRELTFAGSDGRAIFAPWHGKISHRFFRLHFEWPPSPAQTKLPILYLGPKITKG